MSDNTDCDDTDELEFPGQEWYLDVDDDGYGDDGAVSQVSCTRPTDRKTASELGVGNTANDCDDTVNSIYPGATEVCDGVDNNCDGNIDEGVENTYYIDTDGDTYGDPSVSETACSASSGYVSNNTDCDDTDILEYPGQTRWKDVDGDLYSDGVSQVVCERPSDYYHSSEITATSGDCDDTDPGLSPVTTWYKDVDGDGYSDGVSVQQCARPASYYLAGELTATSGDCDDASINEFPGQVRWQDLDGDFYGDGTSTVSCLQPADHLLASVLN